MVGFFSGLSMVSHRLLEHSLEIGVLIALIFLFKRMASKRLPPWWHFSLWLILLVRMLIPLEYENRLSLLNFIPSISPPVVIESVDALPPMSLMPVSGKEAHGGRWPSIWGDLYDSYIPFLWFGGACLFALYIAIKCLAFSWAIKKAPFVTDGAVLALLSETKSRMKIRRNVSVVVTDRVNCPSLFGYFRPRLLLPEGVLKDLSDRELTYALMHELGHLKRHDIGLGWGMAFLQVLYWFNPLVWLAFHRMRLDQELACDALVLARMKEEGGAADYARAIVGFLERFCRNRQLPSLAGILESKVQMVGRITGIVRYERPSGKKRFGAFSLFFATMAFLFMFTGSLQRGENTSTEIPVSGDNMPDRLTGQVVGGHPDSMDGQGGVGLYPANNLPVNGSGISFLPETGVIEAQVATEKKTVEKSDEIVTFHGEEQDAPEMLSSRDGDMFDNLKNVHVPGKIVDSFSRKGDDAILHPQKGSSRPFPESTPVAVEILEEVAVHEKNGRKVYLPSEVDTLPRVSRTYPPRYPYAAKRDNISGSLTVQFVVSKEGVAVSSKVVASEPEGVFDFAALEAMRAYRFEPGIKDGEAVDVLVNLPIKFNLS